MFRRIIRGSDGSPAAEEHAETTDLSMPDPGRLAEFREAVKQGAARAFQATCADHEDEQIYAFALYTDGDAMTVCPAANSEEAYARKSKGEDPSELAILRWATAEWAYEFEHVEFFADAQVIQHDLLRPFDWDAPDAFREELCRAMVAALEELNAANVFGTGPARDRVTVFFTISDSADAEHWEEYSVRRCNPPQVAERFLRSLGR